MADMSAGSEDKGGSQKRRRRQKKMKNDIFVRLTNCQTEPINFADSEFLIALLPE